MIMFDQSTLQKAVETVVAEQPFWRRRKASLIIVAVIVMWVAQDIVPTISSLPPVVAEVIASLGSLALLALNALTADALTPRSGEELMKAVDGSEQL